MISVTIKTLDGKNSPFEVDDEITVEEFKHKIETELNIPVAQQRLIFQGRVLQDGAKLQQCGVQDKVIHLVPRPPPSTQREPAPSAADEPASTTGTGFTGFPWGVDMQQTIQDITSGIFTGLGELGRSAYFQLPAEAELSSGLPSSSSILAAHENTFNSLHTQATQLLRRIIRRHSSPSANRSDDVDSPSTDESAPASPRSLSTGVTFTCIPNETARSGNQSPQTATETKPGDPLESVMDSSPMHVDGDPEDRPQETSQTATSNKAPSASQERSTTSRAGAENPTSREHALSTLADMLSRHRQLWRSAEPYFDQWEAMINSESRMQQHLQSTRQHAKPHNEREDSTADEATRLLSEEVTNVTTTRTLSPPARTTVLENVPNSLSDDSWQHRFFLQISRLLHLHAHMLHLISDFDIIPLPERAPRPADGTPTENSAANQNEGLTGLSVSVNTSNTIRVSDSNTSASPKPDSTSRPYPRRILTVPGFEAQYVRTSVNVEPVGVSGFQPMAVPGVTTSDSRSRINLAPPMVDRRRSQSASVPRRNQTGPITQESQPTVTTTGAVRPTGFPITSTAIRGGPTGTGGAAIVHRVDIPIISMNMINLPLPGFFERVMPPGVTTQSTANTTTNTSTTNSVPTNTSVPATTVTHTSVSHSVPLMSETQVTVTAAPTGASLPRTTHSIPTPRVVPIYPLAAPTAPPFDPFLSCHSWHIAGEHDRTGAQQNTRLFPMPLSIPTVQLTPNPPSGVTTVIGSRAASAPGATPATTSAPSQEPPISTDSTVPPNTTNTTTSSTGTSTPRNESTNNLRFSHGFNLPQQIALLFSAATSAAASAASASGIHMSPSPFNVLVSSSPMQFSMDTTRTVSSTTATDSGISMSTPRMATSDTSRQNQSSRPHGTIGAVRPAPAWADLHGESAATDQPSAPRLLTVFTESLVEAVWLLLGNLAREEGVNINATSYNWRLSQSVERPTPNQRISAGFLLDVLSTVQSELPQMLTNGATDGNETFSPDRLDGMRTQLSYLLVHADTAIRRLSENCLTDGLIRLLFDHRVSDGDVPAIPDSLERRSIGWVCHRIESDRQVIDVRASLARVFGVRLSALLGLWRNSPFDFGFGSGLMMALPNFCVYLLCTIEVLATQLATTTRLSTRLNPHPDPSMFQIITHRLRQFADNSDDTDEARLCRLLATGVQHCIGLYCNYTQENLRSMRERVQNSFVIRRSLATLSSADVDMDPRPSQLEQCFAEDADVEDLPFVDASPDLPAADFGTPLSDPIALEKSRPIGGDQTQDQLVATIGTPVLSGTSDQLRRCANAGNVSPLPDWIPKPGELPEPLSRALDPHPDSARSLNTSVAATNLPNPEGWHAVLPAEWLHVVTGDVATMDRTAAALATSPLDQLRRFSDAYIAGMPAKRRKVMEDHSESMAQPPDAILTECLSDAIRVSGFKSTTETDNPSDDGVVATPERSLSRSKIDLVLSLRELVSERISNRLSSDPDFDPTQFPLSNEAFLKKRMEKP